MQKCKDQLKHNRKVTKHNSYVNSKRKTEGKSKDKNEEKVASTDISISDNSLANPENVIDLKEWILEEEEPVTNDVYLLSQELAKIQFFDDDNFDARNLRKQFQNRKAEDDAINKKLKKIVPKITRYYEEKNEYFKNLDEIFDCLNDKIWNYIDEIKILVDDFWTDDLEDVLEYSDEEQKLFDELLETKYHLRTRRRNAYELLLKKLHDILDFYKSETFHPSMIKLLDKDEKKFQICEFMHYSNYKLKELLDYHIECIISLKEKTVQVCNANHSESHLYQVSEEELFSSLYTQITHLEKPISRPFVPFGKMDMVNCLCNHHFRKSSLMHHIKHPSNSCSKSLTEVEVMLLDDKVTEYAKKVKADKRGRFKQTEMYHIQTKKNNLMKSMKYQKECIIHEIEKNKLSLYTVRYAEKIALNYMNIERKLQYTLCHDWENQMLKAISIISHEHQLNTQICDVMVYCHNEGYNKTYELLKHDLHKLLDPILGGKGIELEHQPLQKRRNAYYCKCGDVPNPEVCFTYGPTYEKNFPPLKEQQSIILAYDTEAHLISGESVNSKLLNLIDFILWKQQCTYNLIVQKIMNLILAINKELKYDYDYPYYDELKILQKPVEETFEKLDSKLSIHSTFPRPPSTQNDVKYWKTYLSKWERGFQEPICICTCRACDYDDYYTSKIRNHPQGLWWAEQQIPKVLKCSSTAKSKKYSSDLVCNIHDENFEFITETRTWSRIVQNKTK